MASKKKKAARGAVVEQRSIPWLLIGAVTVVLVFAVSVFGYAYSLWSDQRAVREAQAAAEKATAAFKPSPENPDPSKTIPGVKIVDYPGQLHVRPDQQIGRASCRESAERPVLGG